MQPLYETWNAQINVISRKDLEHFYERHVLHALAIAKQFTFTPGTRLLDIGTGGGFPAVPLAIFFPEVQITACDSIAKKIKVVQAIAKELQLTNLHTHTGRVEQLNGKFDFVVSRAVAPLSDLYRWTSHQLNKQQRNAMPNGWLCLKGGDLQQEMNDLLQLNKRLYMESFALSSYFTEPFFETKKLLFVH